LFMLVCAGRMGEFSLYFDYLIFEIRLVANIYTFQCLTVSIPKYKIPKRFNANM